MFNIVHRIGMKVPADKVYSELSTVKGISNWWTSEVTGESTVGQIINVRFLSCEGLEVGSMSMKVMSLDYGKSVAWRFITGPTEWIGTEVVFELKEEGDYTIVLFRHQNWREAVEFMAHCSMKWATFLMSLKELLETGVGRPSPQDIKIDNWN